MLFELYSDLVEAHKTQGHFQKPGSQWALKLVYYMIAVVTNTHWGRIYYEVDFIFLSMNMRLVLDPKISLQHLCRQTYVSKGLDIKKGWCFRKPTMRISILFFCLI